MKRRLIVTRGLPGAGKTTRAMRWVAEDPHRRARVGSDHIAAMLHPHAMTGDETVYGPDYAEREQLVANAAIEALLRSGIDVVCDDPFLLPHYLDAVRELAARYKADLIVWDMTDVDIEVCIARDAQRGRSGDKSIGEREIRRQYLQFRSLPAAARPASTASGTTDLEPGTTFEGSFESGCPPGVADCETPHSNPSCLRNRVLSFVREFGHQMSLSFGATEMPPISRFTSSGPIPDPDPFKHPRPSSTVHAR